eukprot:441541_1
MTNTSCNDTKIRLVVTTSICFVSLLIFITISCISSSFNPKRTISQLEGKVKERISHQTEPPNNNHTNTIMLPYTSPPNITYNEYKMYENITYAINNFHQRKYSLFFMGRVYKPFDRYKDRRLAIKYMNIFNESHLHFGIVTDYNNKNKSDLSLILQLCDTNLSSLPCGLTKSNYASIHSKNKLYIYGLKNSKFNLIIHGDTPTSGKFYDAITFNQIPILVGIDQLDTKNLPFSDTIGYEKFSFFIQSQDFADEKVAMQLLHNIVYNISKQKLNYMIQNLTYYKKYLLWNHPQSLVVYNIMKQAKKMPLDYKSNEKNIIKKKMNELKLINNVINLELNKTKRANTYYSMYESQIRVYIMGSGHCGTTFLQQFIGAVILNKSNSFYLFEPAHPNISKLLRCHGYKKGDEFLLINDFFKCKFIDQCDYNSFLHHETTRLINFGENKQILTAEALRNKCKSSKYLIYKDLLDYLMYKDSSALFTQYPNITLINLVRNPLYQIISVSRPEVWDGKFVIKNWINNICVNQPKYHKMLQNVTKKYVIMKMEEFYKNISNSFNETVLYFSNLILDGNNKINMTDILLKYSYMKQNQWSIGMLNPVTKTKYKQMDTELKQIANHSKCQEFANKYNYSLDYHQLL